MKEAVGWILDVYVRSDKAVLWIKLEDGRAIKLMDDYHPRLYVKPTSLESLNNLFQVLSEQPFIVELNLVEKPVGLRDAKEKLIEVVLDSPSSFKKLVGHLRESDLVEELYNVDLLNVQQYLFYYLKIPPSSKVRVKYKGNRLKEIQPMDDSLELRPPPFRILYMDLKIESKSLTPKPDRDPISAIEVRIGEKVEVIRGEETDILKALEEKFREYDPDLIVCPEAKKFTIPYLFKRVKEFGLNVQLGREEVDLRNLTKPIPYWFLGRVVIDLANFEHGLAGLVERARFSFIPLGLAAEWTANRIIDSRNCYELIQRGHVIPENKGERIYARSLMEIAERDKGGLIVSPRIGVIHENVAELDFEAEYPSLIVRDCLSYETCFPDGVKPKKDALLPTITKIVLERRLHFKHLRNSFPKDSEEWLYCEQRQQALKMILVCLYGTSGCPHNRFGNVLTFEEINRRSREVLLKAVDVAMKEGFEVIYCDTDSIFVKKHKASRKDYEELCRKIAGETGLNIALDHHYKFLVLLPLEADPNGYMEAQKRYYGLLMSGEVLARGIELRRHDTPKFIKEFQEELIKTLFSVKDAEEVYTTGFERAKKYVFETIEKLMRDGIPIEKLIVSKILRKPLTAYSRMYPHVSAALQLKYNGKRPKKGDEIKFVYIDADHFNPLNRVAALELYDWRRYDKEKYRDLILDAAETVLAPFGFKRESYGLKPKTMSFKQHLWEEIKRELELEMQSEENSYRF